MNILLWILLGTAVGWLTDFMRASVHGILDDIILGIIGAFVGGSMMIFFGRPGVTGFYLYSIVVAIIGAFGLIYLGRFIHRYSDIGLTVKIILQEKI